jgi:arsenate reductase
MLYADGIGSQLRAPRSMSDKTWTVLVLCTGNSSRSIMAEALFNVLGQGRFRAYSAGSHPSARVNPFAIERCEALGYDTSQLRSKSWDEFAAPDAPPMDFVITVCDQAAGELCPIWPGTPMTAHWGFEDPAAFEGSDADKREVFNKVYRQIMKRVERLLSLPLHVLDNRAIQREMRAIGAEATEAIEATEETDDER